MIYKTLKKVSEYCQLLDKRTFETRTEGGITATYNNDGTFTVSGTATANSWKNFPIFQLLPGGGEHVYLFNVAGISGDTNCYCTIYFYDEVIHSAVELMQAGIEGSAVIKKLETPTVYQARFNITTLTGATPNNIVYKPQLFDLTEMYGAGNEPTTVEEFREKFPNELYDYKPYCFVRSYKTLLKAADDKIITSYKKSLICTTKNLLDSDNYLKLYTCTYNNGTVKQTYFEQNIISSIKVNLCYDYTFVKRLSSQSIYTLGQKSFTFTKDETFNGIQVGCNGSKADVLILYSVENLTDGETYTVSINLLNNKQGEFEFNNIQLEEGSTATEYHPYGYL